MATFVSMYPKPEDAEGFDAYFRETHLPIVQRWPGVQQLRVTRLTSTPRGGEPDYYLLVEAAWETDEEMAAALRSDAGAESARDARTIAQKFGVMPSMALGSGF